MQLTITKLYYHYHLNNNTLTNIIFTKTKVNYSEIRRMKIQNIYVNVSPMTYVDYIKLKQAKWKIGKN